LKKLLLLIASLTLMLSLAACKEDEVDDDPVCTDTQTLVDGVCVDDVVDGGTLTIFQNKIEINDVLGTYADAWGVTNDVTVEVKSCGGDACAYGTQILAEFQGDVTDQPDIFVIEGMGGFVLYEDKILDLTGETWTTNTDLEFVVDGVTYGFPVAVEGWGMAYNLDILTAAGVDPLDLTNLAAYTTAFAAIQAYYDAESMDDYAVVSMAAAAGMSWVTGLHNFNAYLSAGLDYNDSTVIDNLNAGIADDARLNSLADWVELLFDYADPTVLTEGGYDDQVGLFDLGMAAFIHQGNWIDGNLTTATFTMGYAPHAAMAGENDSIFVGAPSFYVINKDSDNIEEAKQFLDDLAATSEGHDYMVNEANMVPAFNSVTLLPSTPLSAAVMAWNQSGNVYAWWQNDMPSGFGMEVLGLVYEAYAGGLIDKTEFIAQLKAAIEELATS